MEKGLVLTRQQNGIYAEAGTAGKHLFFEVRELLRERQRTLPLFVNLFVGVILEGIIAGWLYIVRYFHLVGNPRIIGRAAAAMLIPYFAVFAFYFINGYSDMRLERRVDQPSFWKRNQDDLLKLAIGGIIGALLQWVFTHLGK